MHDSFRGLSESDSARAGDKKIRSTKVNLIIFTLLRDLDAMT